MGNRANKQPQSSVPPLEVPPGIARMPRGVSLYGSRGIPTAVQYTRLDSALLEHLAKDFLRTPADTQPRTFFRCVDYPDIPDHIYYEGYFHSCRTPAPVRSINPRNGRPFEKPAAPKSIRAFLTAFRHKNQALLRVLSRRIEEFRPRAPASDSDPPNPTRLVAELFNPDGPHGDVVCGDLAVQVHYGAPVPYDHVGWHIDSVNSLFHMAISISSTRALYSDTHTEPGELTREQRDELMPFVDCFVPGDVYISSPALFYHGVQYPGGPRDNPTIAVQARFLLSEENLEALLGTLSLEFKHYLGGLLSSVFCGRSIGTAADGADCPTRLEFPSLDEVLQVEATLE